jgi:hypothetical protein
LWANFEFVEPDVNGPPVSLNPRGAFAHPAISDFIVHNITTPILAMPARTAFAQARHFLGVGLKLGSSCRQNP